MNLTEEQLLQNWKDLMQVINKKFVGERRQKLLAMYESFQERMMFAPASGNINYHNAFVGGYVEHVLRVVKCAESTYKLWEEMGSSMQGYTVEELMFAAVNHDLGKVGDLDKDLYVPNPSEWHRKNQGSLWNLNPELNWMPVQHRSLWLLQHHGIKVSENEMIAIMVHDGLYDEANKPYFVAFRPESRMRINLPIILHHTDHMASQIEYEMWKGSNSTPVKESKKTARKAYNSKTVSGANDSAKDLFKDLFGEAE